MNDQLLVSWDLQNGTGDLKACGEPARILGYAIGVVIGLIAGELFYKYKEVSMKKEDSVITD